MVKKTTVSSIKPILECAAVVGDPQLKKHVIKSENGQRAAAEWLLDLSTLSWKNKLVNYNTYPYKRKKKKDAQSSDW